MDKISKGNIKQIQGDYAFIDISIEENKKVSNINRKCRLDSISFRGKPAPRNLIIKDTIVNCRTKPDGNLEFFLENDLLIIVKFGKIKSIDSAHQTFIANDGIADHEASFTQLLSSDGKKLPIDHILMSQNSPILIFFNVEALIECKKIDENTSMTFTLDVFARGQTGIEDRSFFCFKDTRLIVHKIIANNVVYKNTDFLFRLNDVSNSVGAQVKVEVRNGKILAEVDAQPPNNSDLTRRNEDDSESSAPNTFFNEREMKSSKDDMILVRTENYSSTVTSRNSAQFPPALTVNSRNSAHFVPASTSNSRNSAQLPPASTVSSRNSNQFTPSTINAKTTGNQNRTLNIKPSNPENQQPVIKKLGTRIYDKSLQYHFLETEHYKANYIILIALLEVCYRFPQHYTRNALYYKLKTQMITKIGENFDSTLQQPFMVCRDPRYRTNIDELYRIIETNKIQFEALFSEVIQDPPDFQEISETFQVSIYVYNKAYIWEQFHPFSKEGRQFPMICFSSVSDLKIYYTKEMMEFDGYHVPSLILTNPAEIDKSLIMFTAQRQTPNIVALFENILEFETFTSHLAKGRENEFYIMTKKITNSLKALAEDIPDEQFNQLQEMHSKMKEIKVAALRCMCGDDTNGKYVCKNNHSHCNNCALAATRLEKCLSCENAVQFALDENVYKCSGCNNNTYQTIYYVAFQCSCVFCTSCFYQAYSINPCTAHGQPLSQEVINKLYYYCQKLFNSSQ